MNVMLLAFMATDDALLCRDCGKVTPKADLSTTGPIKEIDEDGRLTRRWAYVCPHCFGHTFQPHTGNT